MTPNQAPPNNPHFAGTLLGKSRGALFSALQSSEQGLGNKEADRRQQTYALNQIQFHRSYSLWRMLLQEFIVFGFHCCCSPFGRTALVQARAVT